MEKKIEAAIQGVNTNRLHVLAYKILAALQNNEPNVAMETTKELINHFDQHQKNSRKWQSILFQLANSIDDAFEPSK